MSKPKLTPWYPPEVKPVRAGVYERDMPGNLGKYSYWANGVWYGWAAWVDSAANNYKKGGASCLQDRPWRGLTEKSK